MTHSNPSDGSHVRDRMAARFEAARASSECVGLLSIEVDRLARAEQAEPDRAREWLGRLDDLLSAQLARIESVVASRASGRVALVLGYEVVELERLGRELVRLARAEGLSLSIGVAHDPDRSQPELELLARVAAAGLEVAQRGGGNRMVHTDQYGASLSAAPEPPELPEPLVRLDEVERPGTPEPDEPLPAFELPRPEPAELAQPVQPAQPDLIESLRQALAGDAHSPHMARFQDALEGLLHEQPGQDLAHEQVELLERRVAKLAAALELAEGEIARLQRHPEAETGVASIYREVQGLTAGEPLEAVKRQLMAGIFEANAALQGARDERVER